VSATKKTHALISNNDAIFTCRHTIDMTDSSSSSDDEDDTLDLKREAQAPLKVEDFDRFRVFCRDKVAQHEEECRGRIETIYNSDKLLERSIDEARELTNNPELTVEQYSRRVRGVDGDPVLLRLVSRTIRLLQKTEPGLLNLNVRQLDALLSAKVYDDEKCPADLKNVRWTHTPIWDQLTSGSRYDDRLMDITRAFLADFQDGKDYIYLLAKYKGAIMRETKRVQALTPDAGEWDRVMDEAKVPYFDGK
jgi:hypothetical protein